MILPAPLWAVGLGDLIPIVIVIVFLILSAAGQWIAKKAQPQPPGGARRPPGRPGGGPGGRPGGGNVEDEIGDFLRRAAERRAGERPRPGGRPVMAEIVEPEILPERAVGGQVDDHVGEYLDTGKFDRQAAELGDEVAHTDRQLEERLHQRFDHQMSRLAGIPGESADEPRVQEPVAPENRLSELPPTAAAGLIVFLGNAENLRQAILINEILQRPEHRWT